MLLAPVVPDCLVNTGLCSVWGRVVVVWMEGRGRTTIALVGTAVMADNSNTHPKGRRYYKYVCTRGLAAG